jgi:hypothetical protein
MDPARFADDFPPPLTLPMWGRLRVPSSSIVTWFPNLSDTFILVQTGPELPSFYNPYDTALTDTGAFRRQPAQDASTASVSAWPSLLPPGLYFAKSPAHDCRAAGQKGPLGWPRRACGKKSPRAAVCPVKLTPSAYCACCNRFRAPSPRHRRSMRFSRLPPPRRTCPAPPTAWLLPRRPLGAPFTLPPPPAS